MNIDSLVAYARQKVSGRVPRYIDLDAAIRLSRQDVTDMVTERMQTAMEQAILGAQSILRSTCQEYIEGLYIKEDLTIGIRESASHLEYGYDERQMLGDILSSPKAKVSADGNKYMVIPLGQKKDAKIESAIEKKTSELFQKGKQAGASGSSLRQMVDDMRSVIYRSGNAPRNTRTVNENAFRTATDKQDPESKWVHPGFQGVNQLEFINSQLRVDLQEQATRILENQVDRMRQ